MKIDSREERKSRNGDGDDDGDYDGCGGSGICLFFDLCTRMCACHTITIIGPVSVYHQLAG